MAKDKLKEINTAQKTELSRRDFITYSLKGAGIFGVLIAVGPNLTKAASKLKELNGEYDWAEHYYAYVVDTRKCIGCGMCVRACKNENKVPDGYYRTWVERYVISEKGEAEIDSPQGGLDGFKQEEVIFNSNKAFFVPKLCNHCRNTPCTQVCPVGASYQTKDGVVLVDGDHCIGCGYCVQACPYGSRFIHPETHTASKCTWCYHRITKGLKPACVQACPVEARLFGDLKNRDDRVRRIIAEERVQVLQKEHLTKPYCFYIGLDKEVR
ncbi:MAG: 4Fe-4S dicluster domain-containing protein [Myxococcota bacterium]